MALDVIALTQALVRQHTVDAGEDGALEIVAPVLDRAGFALTSVPWQRGRSNLVATWRGGGPLVLSGHLDTVPFGDTAWVHDPLGGDVDKGRLFGRGASDMKGGVAAMVLAAVGAAGRGSSGFSLALTAGEETGCGGASAVRAAGLLRSDSVFVIGEATGNEVRLGHKGATWLRLTARGTAAHGSRPDLGVNAIERLADAITALRHLGHGGEHPYLGKRSTNIGTISGGTQTNLVPDLASMTIDVRGVPGADADTVRVALESYGTVETLLDLGPVWSDPSSALTGRIIEAVATVTGTRAAPSGVSYFADATVLDGTAARSYIIGPGDIDQPHRTDESVSTDRLIEAVEIYRAIIEQVAPAASQ
ncbi:MULTISPECIES: M20 family metallopeptidase [Microbacterium]|uniref:Acetylornithine deacetylase n=1 Tax=Microbacterium saccharophilum TaxID=1213358 RepID=A0A7Z7CVR6_9MICO|nr:MULTISPECIES: M20 family metallopeptidase [Microbacterium]SFI18032.1 acetylornithine deacetylase [Microbacterium saccharophilum]